MRTTIPKSTTQCTGTMSKYYRAIRRSGLEDKIEDQLKRLKVSYRYEDKVDNVGYMVPASFHVYHPDFVITTDSGKQIIIEAKGIWDKEDRDKHMLLRQQHPELDIRFVFSYSKTKIRKGSKVTYRDVCDGKLRTKPFKGTTWQYADKLIPLEWTKE